MAKYSIISSECNNEITFYQNDDNNCEIDIYLNDGEIAETVIYNLDELNDFIKHLEIVRDNIESKINK
mgnify:CR=1 FL=1